MQLFFSNLNLNGYYQTANGRGGLLPSPRYQNGPYGNRGGGPQNGNSSRPRSLIMQKVDDDSSSNLSRRNSEAPTISRRNSTISQYEDRIEQEQNKAIDNVDKAAQDGSNKMAQAKANLADDLAYVKAGSRRASKYDLY